ncbi:putative methyltransferase [Gordonia araii NBRC 100433]|uniref:Putative methyltransferase n=1 Tax=Gordonia araii NBRC 100433 TaxID=1073574 RepID=G7H4X3_9ACTN|nr:class I SAM-dependent methyltransferase [Gordonia araii]NNG97960.1 class I SAM-dependent methyltransferase [Gordonia araii NBRC 100433]GAB10898.1 putative methyltransferase [Gordonia araii NBRC 100433]
MKETINLGSVQETLLVPLYGRAVDARRRRSILSDTRAAEIVDGIDYDFSKFSVPNTAGSVWRASIFDGFVRDFLAVHPEGTVTDLGCGLSTRFDRLDNGRVTWLDIDLEDVIDLRRRFVDDGDRYRMLVGSLLETDWYEAIDAAKPVLLLSEGVLLYFHDHEVTATLRSISAAFPGARLAFDTSGEKMVRGQDRTHADVPADFHWACDDPADLERYGLRLLESHSFGNPPKAVVGAWPLLHRLGIKVIGRVPLSKVYRFNLFECTPG